MPPKKAAPKPKTDHSLAVLLDEDGMPKSTPRAPRTYIPLGSYFVDTVMLKNGGIPKGMITEIFAESDGAGKSLLLYNIIANHQQMEPDGVTVLIDAEDRYDETWVKRIGVDTSPNRLRVFNIGNIEEMAVFLALAIKSGKLTLLGIDSVGALATTTHTNPENYKKGIPITVGEIPRKLNSVIDLIMGEMRKGNLAWVNVNQNRKSIGVMFGDPNVRPGGEKFKFLVTTRLKVTLREKITAPVVKGKKGEQVIGFRVGITVLKNSVGGRTVDVKATDDSNHLKIMLDTGAAGARVENLFEEAIDLDILVLKGSVYNWFSPKKKSREEPYKKIQGKDKFKKMLLDDPAMLAKLQEHIEIVREKNA